MTDTLDVLYGQALRRAEDYLAKERSQINAEDLIRIFLTSLLDFGYGIAPLEPTDQMADEKNAAVSDYHRAVYRKMISRRPRLNL